MVSANENNEINFIWKRRRTYAQIAVFIRTYIHIIQTRTVQVLLFLQLRLHIHMYTTTCIVFVTHIVIVFIFQNFSWCCCCYCCCHDIKCFTEGDNFLSLGNIQYTYVFLRKCPPVSAIRIPIPTTTIIIATTTAMEDKSLEYMYICVCARICLCEDTFMKEWIKKQSK
ncbi:unnamed protein product [Ceratitis capitata]|uniref:(Mediterranean fruit fly) hypothetical protein n=1 Tax=Ceratitis capitata TaxID=7213 RepID=A0A811UK91_CERCA|nr:unnamed protein product [Ceratitis capitata]